MMITVMILIGLAFWLIPPLFLYSTQKKMVRWNREKIHTWENKGDYSYKVRPMIYSNDMGWSFAPIINWFMLIYAVSTHLAQDPVERAAAIRLRSARDSSWAEDMNAIADKIRDDRVAALEKRITELTG